MAETLKAVHILLPRTGGGRHVAEALVAAALTETPNAQAIVLDATACRAFAQGATDELVKRSMEHLGWEHLDRLALVGGTELTRRYFRESIARRKPATREDS